MLLFHSYCFSDAPKYGRAGKQCKSWGKRKLIKNKQIVTDIFVSVQQQFWNHKIITEIMKTILNFLVAPIAATNLFQFDLDKPWNYPQYCNEKCTAAPFWKSRGKCVLLSCFPGSLVLFTQYKTIWLTAISSNCLAALLAKMPAFNSHWRQNTYCRNLKWTFEKLVAMLLLRNKGQ